MSMHPVRNERRASSTIILWITVLVLLFAQGVRVCIHSADEAPNGHHASSTHVEVGFLADEASEGEDNGHASLSAILKDVQTKLSLFVVLPVLLLLLPIATPRRIITATESSSFTRLGWRLTPPLRAPPR